MSKLRQINKYKLDVAIGLQNGLEPVELTEILKESYNVFTYDIDLLMMWIETQIKCRVNLKKRKVTTQYNTEGYTFDYFLNLLENNASYYISDQQHKIKEL